MSSLSSPQAPPYTAPSASPTFLDLARRLFRSYAFRVTAQGIFTIWAVTTFTFILIRQMPGNPIEIRISQIIQAQNVTYEEALAQAAGLFDFDPSKPLIEQYVDYLGKVARGDLGESIVSAGTPVISQIMRYLPWTLFSVGLGLLFSFTVGILIGMAMAYWRGSVFDNVMTVFASVTFSIPNYIIALLILLIAGVQLQLFSVGQLRGAVDPSITPGFTLEYIASILEHAFLPVLTYVSATVGGWMLTMKSSTLATLGEEYVTVARARGLKNWRILTSYVGRNAMLPLVTQLAVSIGFVIGGSVIIEVIFVYPGIGSLLSSSIANRDYTTMQGVFLIIAIAVVLSNTLADILYGLLDPRISTSGER
ncbi:MAG: ABC transporter permease [bacterium]|nr:ABC transporter permease [bacterium]